jgi:hypothetical protein
MDDKQKKSLYWRVIENEKARVWLGVIYFLIMTILAHYLL